MPKLLHDATGNFKAEEEGSADEKAEERVRNDNRSIVPAGDEHDGGNDIERIGEPVVASQSDPVFDESHPGEDRENKSIHHIGEKAVPRSSVWLKCRWYARSTDSQPRRKEQDESAKRCNDRQDLVPADPGLALLREVRIF